MGPRVGRCDKCNTQANLYEYNDKWLCKINACIDEEIERESGIQEIVNERLEQYRRLCQATL